MIQDSIPIVSVVPPTHLGVFWRPLKILGHAGMRRLG
jgi:hypothetical protein